MKSTLKYLALFLLSTSAVIFSLVIILSLDAKKGALAALLFILASFILFSLSILGVIKGNLNFMLLRNRLEVIGLLAFSVFLALFAGLVSFGNAVIEIGLGKQELDAEEKARYAASTFFTVPSQKNLLTAEKNGIDYFYPQGSEAFIDKFDGLLHEEQERFDHLFGKDEKTDLTIEIHDNYESLQIGNPIDDVAGYYSMMNDTLYLYPEEGEWKEVLLHEYSHYRIDQFSEESDLKMARIPQWFQEGVSEYMGTLEENLMDYEYMETVDFRLLDSNESFHEAGSAHFDPYIQSYLAVDVLVEENGEEIITDLLSAESLDEFYQKLEGITEQSIEGFQTYFLAKLIADRKAVDDQFNQAYSAMQMKDYEKASEMVNKIKTGGKQYDIEAADLILKDIYLEKGFYAEAAALLENKIETGYEYARLTNLLLLAEVYIFSDPEKAMEKLRKAQQEESADFYREGALEEFEGALDKIIDGDWKTGFIELIEKDLIMQEKIRKDIVEALETHG